MARGLGWERDDNTKGGGGAGTEGGAEDSVGWVKEMEVSGKGKEVTAASPSGFSSDSISIT